jgi:hypothetical protein
MKLSAKAIELLNMHELTAELMARGWNVYLPVYDEGIDLLATRNDVSEVIRIQLKSRWSIDRKYVGRPIEIAYKDRGTWYLAPHEAMVLAGEQEGYCAQTSWTGDKGMWNVATMSVRLAERMAPHALSNRLGPRLVQA